MKMCVIKGINGTCRAHNDFMNLDRNGKPIRLKACTDGEAMIAGIKQAREGEAGDD